MGVSVEAKASHWSDTLAGPRGLPILGQIGQIRVAQMHQQLEQWAAIYGPLYRMRFLRQPVLVCADAELTAAASRDRPDGWRRPRFMARVIDEMDGAGLFSAEGDEWRAQRRLTMAAFDPTHLKTYFPTLVQVTERLQKHLTASAGAPLDLQSLLMRFTVDVTAGLAFGTDMNTLEAKDQALQKHLDKMFPMLMRRLNIPFPYWRYFKLPIDRAFDRHLAAIRRAVEPLIAQARERIARAPDAAPANLLEGLLLARDEQGRALNERQLYGNVLTILLAGEDTTANTLAWALYLLHQHPACWAALRTEVDAVLGDAPLPQQFDQLRSLPYLEACVNETMRLRPVAPLHFMEAQRATRLGDVDIAADELVIFVKRPPGVDCSLSADADRFDPQRWLKADSTPAEHALLKAAMPFGAGPRLCPGRYLALAEMKMVLGLLARSFDLVEVGCENGAAPEECLAFTMFPQGLQLRVRPRH
ncbi:MAG TPA: cytochrome P450 [Burkholderiaceae bacterium]